jgi:hypothetical protein
MVSSDMDGVPSHMHRARRRGRRANEKPAMIHRLARQRRGGNRKFRIGLHWAQHRSSPAQQTVLHPSYERSQPS